MKYKNDVPFFEEGIPLDRVSFSGGRVSADIARHGGVTAIKYYGRQRLNAVNMFEADAISAWKQLFRLFIKIDNRMYYAEFNDTSIHPYGYDSSCSVENVCVRHRLTLLQDALVFEMFVDSAPEDCQLSFVMTLAECCVKSGGLTRNWSSFAIEHECNSLVAKVVDDNRNQVKTAEAHYLTQVSQFGFAESDYAETYIALTSSQAMEMTKTPSAFEKDYAAITPNDGYGNFTILFGHDKTEFEARLAEVKQTARRECEALKEHYRQIAAVQTRISGSSAIVQSLMNNARSIIESLKVKDIPGGMRAADSGYWIWGWDSMVHSDAAMFSGNHQWVKDMLEFYRATAHPELGIFHNMDLAGNPMMAMAHPAQTLYAIMLYNYYTHTLDVEALREYYDFAVTVVNRALAHEVGSSGLVKGVALYPDFPEYLDQNGNDISSFNNSICYQAVRSMEELASILGNKDDATVFKSFAKRMRTSFNKHLFDDGKGYYFDSISADDFSPRHHYPAYAVLWLSDFAKELVAGSEGLIAEFMMQNLKTRTGVSMLPRWDKSFMADGNQLGIYMPVTEGFFRQMMRLSDREENLMRVIEQEWARVMIPEALTAEPVNHGLTPDNPGRKQAFCLNSWYSLYFSYYLGMSMSPERISFCKPMCVDNELKVNGLRWGDKTIDIHVDVSSRDNVIVRINGKAMESGSIPYSALAEKNLIELKN